MPQQGPPKRTVPASISYTGPKKAAISQSMPATAQQTNMPITTTQKANSAADDLLSKSKALNIEDKTNQNLEQVEEEKALETAASEIQDLENNKQLESNKKIEISNQADTAGSRDDTQGIPSDQRTSKLPKRKRIKVPKGITADMFVKAFSQAAFADQSSRYNTGDIKDNATVNDYSSNEYNSGSAYSSEYGNSDHNENYGNAPEHVKARLREWKIADYLQKISAALIRACKLSGKHIYIDREVDEDFIARLLINKDGTFTVAVPNPITGVKEVDDFLANFFAQIDLPPIPKHLNLNNLVHSIQIRLKIQRGGSYIFLEPKP